MNKETSEAWDLRVSSALAEIVFQETNEVNGYAIQVFFIFPIACRIPNHFGDSWLIPVWGIKT
jgi:hypothetical protein